MSEDTITGLDYDDSIHSTSLDAYSSSVVRSLREEYDSYLEADAKLVDEYSSDAYFTTSSTSTGSERDFSSEGSARAQGGGSYYVRVVSEDLEKEIDYLPIKDWQGELQTLLKLPDSQEKYRGIARLGLDFQHAASLYARVIVSECKLPESQKTIHTADVGGVAGGTFQGLTKGLKNCRPSPKPSSLLSISFFSVLIRSSWYYFPLENTRY